MNARLLQLVSPRHRRWRRLLASLTFDPDVDEVRAPGPHDFIICGSPRTGTALLTAELFRPPRVVTVMEPWDGLRLGPAELFFSLRAEVLGSGGLRRGKLDIDALRSSGAVAWWREGRTAVPVDSDVDHLLGVKWPGFWRYLPHLPDTKFLICVRDPVTTIASYKATGGRLADGLEYDVAFHHSMNDSLESATNDVRVRRVLLYEYINSRIVPFVDRPNVFVVRYERWASEPQELLHEIGEFLGESLDRIRAPVRESGAPALAGDELDLVRAHCHTAPALGYSLP